MLLWVGSLGMFGQGWFHVQHNSRHLGFWNIVLAVGKAAYGYMQGEKAERGINRQYALWDAATINERVAEQAAVRQQQDLLLKVEVASAQLDAATAGATLSAANQALEDIRRAPLKAAVTVAGVAVGAAALTLMVRRKK